MRPQKQKYLHDPKNNIWGDCQRTAIACILDMDRDDVPHFAQDFKSHEEVIERERKWLLEQGFLPYVIAYRCTLDELLGLTMQNNPGIYYMLSGQSTRGVNHSVVALSDKIVWDPSLQDSGIVGPCDDGYYWVTLFIPTRFTST